MSETTRRRGRKWFVVDLEHRTEHAKRLLDEIERQRHEAERQDLLFTTPVAQQLENELKRTEALQVEA